MPRVEDLVSSPLTELATVICSPSRIHAPPRPQTSRVWNGDQFSRSRRAGIRLRMGRASASVVLMGSPLVGKAGPGAGAPCLSPLLRDNGCRHITQPGEKPAVARHDVDAGTMTSAGLLGASTKLSPPMITAATAPTMNRACRLTPASTSGPV